MYPRIRTIKPELFRHEELYDLEVQTGLPLRLAFAGLWCCCDREGRFKWRPKTLKSIILPFDDIDFSRVLDAWATRGFVVKYASPDGEELGFIPSWSRHQHVNNRESESTLPKPPQVHKNHKVDACPTRAPRDTDACPTPAARKGKEGKGTEPSQDHVFGSEDKAPQAALVPIATWLAFVEMRKKSRKPFTDHARDLIIIELQKLKDSGEDPVLVVEQSIRNGWLDVFPVRKENRNGKPKPRDLNDAVATTMQGFATNSRIAH